MLEGNISTNKRLASPEAPGSAWAPLLLSTVTAVALGRSFLNLQAPRNSEHHRWSPTLGRENSRGSFSWWPMVGVYLARKDQQNQCMVSTRLIYLTGLTSFDGPEFTKPGTLVSFPWSHSGSLLGPFLIPLELYNNSTKNYCSRGNTRLPLRQLEEQPSWGLLPAHWA